MLEELEAAEDLPVRVLHPARYRLLVREIVAVFEILQAHHEPGWLRRPIDRLVETAKGRIEVRSGHQLAEPHQRMAHIDDSVQTLAEQVAAMARRLGRSHRKTPGIAAGRLDSRHFPIL